MGIGALFQIELGNDLYTGLAGHKPFDEAGRTNAANFLRAAAAKFKGKKVMFELLNEPNIDKFWPLDGPDSGKDVSIAEIQQGAVDYAALAQVVVPAMRSADGDPSVFIIGPALAGRGGNSAGELRRAHEYIKQLYALDALSPLFDRISLHLYTAEGEPAKTDMPIGQEPESVDIDLYRGRDLINDSNTNIMCTEQGWKAKRDANGYRTAEGDRLQASFNVRDHIIALSKSVRFRTWYGWGNSAGDYLIEGYPAGIAAATLSDELEDYRFSRRIWTGNVDQWVTEFVDATGNKKLVAWNVWTTTAASCVYPPAAGKPCKSVTGVGLPSVLADGTVSLSVDPIYIDLNPPMP